MNQNDHSRQRQKDSDYERATRLIRWITIAIVLATFPWRAPQAPLVLALIILSLAYNLARFITPLLRVKVFASPITMLVVDNVLVATFLCLAGTVSTPFSAFLVFMLISAGYRYGSWGVAAVLAGQSAFLVIAVTQTQFPPIQLDLMQSLVSAVAVLLAIGLFVVWLTRLDRHERSALRTLGRENAAERERLLTLINTLNDAIFVTDAKGHVLLSNGAAKELAGGQEFAGKDLATVLPLRPRAKREAAPVRIVEPGSAQIRRDLSLFHDGGQAVDLDISVTPVQLDGEKDSNYIIVCRDITKERSLERQREEFISVASHELRTPLTIVEAAISTSLMEKGLPPQIVTLLEQAHRNVVFLSELTRDLTTLSQAQNDSIPIQLKPVDARALLHQLGIDFEAEAKQKNLPIQVVIAPDTPSVLSTEHHIREVLQNYVNNALKYTKEGHITLKAEPSQTGGVLFSVSDTGIGISTNDQRHLFSKFYRAEDYRTRETGGNGLGLYLCLELAQRLNAKIWCKSVLNQGSTFFLEVPPFSRLERDHGKVVEAHVSSLVDQL